MISPIIRRSDTIGQLPKYTDSRNLFIDFLKGICIICVVIAHNLPPVVMKYTVFILWGGMAVPLFLLIQCYHVFNTDRLRKDKGLQSKSYCEQYRIGKIWKSIIKPFLFITIVTGTMLVIKGHNPVDVLKASVISGGLGPGSYYVWIYLQFFLLLPPCLTLINKIGGGYFNIIAFYNSKSRT